jgi:hypothetical protein
MVGDLSAEVVKRTTACPSEWLVERFGVPSPPGRWPAGRTWTRRAFDRRAGRHATPIRRGGPPRLPAPSRRRRIIDPLAPDPDRDRLPPWLLAHLADLVGHPVITTVHAADGPAVVIRQAVHRIETVDETAYVHFDASPQGTKLVLPAAQLKRFCRGGPDGDPDRIDLTWAAGQVEIKLMSDAAQIARWRRRVEDLRHDGNLDALRADTALLQAMLDSAAGNAEAALADALNRLGADLRIRRLQWGVLDDDPREAPQFDRPEADSDDLDDDDPRRYEW